MKKYKCNGNQVVFYQPQIIEANSKEEAEQKMIEYIENNPQDIYDASSPEVGVDEIKEKKEV